ncbi:MAG TPA: hypothetical protein VND22_10215 [Actinomycetota bacterium]|nr:hypothetical protein [Actinomycetota bacterium]
MSDSGEGLSLDTPLSWYEREDWEHIGKVAVDPEKRASTYEEWLTEAQKLFDWFVERGTTPEKANIRAEDMIAWCAQHDRVVDENSRAIYIGRECGAMVSGTT